MSYRVKGLKLTLSAAVICGCTMMGWAQYRYFDEYTFSRTSWKEEKIRLDNFALHLLETPDRTGYIAYFVKKNGAKKVALGRARRAQKYIIKKYRIRVARVVVLFGGISPEASIVLEPRPSSDPPPKFGLTGPSRQRSAASP